MSSSQVAFEPRDFMHDGNYPSMGDHHVPDTHPNNTFGEHHDGVANELTDDVNYSNTGVPNFDAADDDLDLASPPTQNNIHNDLQNDIQNDLQNDIQNNLQNGASPSDDQPPQQTSGRVIAKPDRVAVKNANGKYECKFEGCKEKVKEFVRKCEWNKHMDKHERPYRCNKDGCEKLPGFTYAGGLLRHEREVHLMHGGPKKPVPCPHNTCKRFAGKRFSRMENLWEHVRRVHDQTPEELVAYLQKNDPEGLQAFLALLPPGTFSFVGGMPVLPRNTPPPLAGQRRKRAADDDVIDVAAVLQENKRLKQEVDDLKLQVQEIDELRRQVHNQNIQTNQLLTQLAHQAATIDQANALALDNGSIL
ncbi:C2H2 transcription factor [Coniochaeta sp. 2T2.1]|nr:C2H2 transcription factor [Coniochaeta sp. 2T2.1]